MHAITTTLRYRMDRMCRKHCEKNISANQRVQEACLGDREQLVCQTPQIDHPGRYRPQRASLDDRNELLLHAGRRSTKQLSPLTLCEVQLGLSKLIGYFSHQLTRSTMSSRQAKSTRAQIPCQPPLNNRRASKSPPDLPVSPEKRSQPRHTIRRQREAEPLAVTPPPTRSRTYFIATCS